LSPITRERLPATSCRAPGNTNTGCRVTGFKACPGLHGKQLPVTSCRVPGDTNRGCRLEGEPVTGPDTSFRLPVTNSPELKHENWNLQPGTYRRLASREAVNYLWRRFCTIISRSCIRSITSAFTSSILCSF
jgi:hypothetical protein